MPADGKAGYLAAARRRWRAGIYWSTLFTRPIDDVLLTGVTGRVSRNTSGLCTIRLSEDGLKASSCISEVQAWTYSRSKNMEWLPSTRSSFLRNSIPRHSPKELIHHQFNNCHFSELSARLVWILLTDVQEIYTRWRGLDLKIHLQKLDYTT